MGQTAGRPHKLTGRSAMYSPGAPSVRREIQRQFWKHIATGITSEKAAEAVAAPPSTKNPDKQRDPEMH